MKLIEHIVRNDRPFTEIVTADYIMVTPYTARGYGIFDEVKGKFKNPDDPFEYVPVKLKALVGRSKAENQESATGFYPHAGILSTFQYLHPLSDDGNQPQPPPRPDVLPALPRRGRAGAGRPRVGRRRRHGEVQDPDHAGGRMRRLPQDARSRRRAVPGLLAVRGQGVYGRRKGGWFTDMFAAGFEGEDLPAAERVAFARNGSASARRRTRASPSPWSSTSTTSSPAARCCCRRRTLKIRCTPRSCRAYSEQRHQIEAIAARFARSGFNLKAVFKDWIVSDFYRADGLATAIKDPCRRAELDDAGLVRMLSPEQVERKVGAVFGEKWGRLTDQLAMLYGGIDSKEVTERAADPSGAMGAIQRTLSNDVACKHVARDFRRPAARTTAVPRHRADVVPGASAEGDRRFAGPSSICTSRSWAATTPWIPRRSSGRSSCSPASSTTPANRRGSTSKRLISAGRATATLREPVADPHYTIRAWRGVVTYLLRRPEFLYE